MAALIKSVFPALAPALVVQAITSSARDKPQGGYDQEVGSGTVDATAALKMAGRLARDRGTGRGLAAAAEFGGGTTAIPPVPVAARSNRQFLVDSLIALACLAVVLIVAFRLIATRRPAAAGVPAVWPSPGAARRLEIAARHAARRLGASPSTPGGWAGTARPGSRASWWLDRSRPATPGSRAPGGWPGSWPG